MLDSENILNAVHLSCIRSNQLLFSNISFQLLSGELLFIEGLNGVGKSSLLRILAGLMQPQSGEVTWRQKPIRNSDQQFFEIMHFVGHANGLKLGLTPTENLQLMYYLSLSNSKFAIEKLLDTLQLSQFKDIPVQFLSAGQRRRLALAKLILFPKTLWLLDEPLTALDKNTQVLFSSWLKTHLLKGGLAIISSHQPIPIQNVHYQRLILC